MPKAAFNDKKMKIYFYMKANQADIQHLYAIKNAFLEADEERCGRITKKQLMEAILETKRKFPIGFMASVMEDMQEDLQDGTENANLIFENLKDIIEVYSNCPLFMKGDSNNSDCFKGSLDSNKEFTNKYERIDKLLKYVHARIEEKFRGFR